MNRSEDTKYQHRQTKKNLLYLMMTCRKMLILSTRVARWRKNGSAHAVKSQQTNEDYQMQFKFKQTCTDSTQITRTSQP